MSHLNVYIWIILLVGFQCQHINVIDKDTRSNGHFTQLHNNSVNFHMDFPKVREMYNQIVTSVMWAGRWDSHISGKAGLAWCSSTQDNHMVRCGAKYLLDVWLQDNSHPNGNKRGYLKQNITGTAAGDVGDLEQHNIDLICSKYKTYGKCMTTPGNTAPQDCVSLTKIGLDIFYEYLCYSDGRKELVQSGECLTRLSVARLSSRMQMTGQTCTDPEGFSGMWATLMAVLRKENLDAEQDIGGIMHELMTTCKFWDDLTRCYVPALRDLCGKSAAQFYNGLMSKMKTVLAGVLKPLGQTYEKYAKCDIRLRNELFGAHTMKTFINDQISRQAADYKEALHRTCQCAGIAVIDHGSLCFWKAMSTVPAHYFSHPTTLFGMQYHFCNPDGLANHFLGCYQGTTESCRLAAVLNISGVIESTCAMVKTAHKNMECTLALTAGNKLLQQCDMTFSGFLRSILLQANMIYKMSTRECIGNLTGATSAFPEQSCISDALKHASQSPKLLNICGQPAMDTILRGIQELADIPKRAEKLYAAVYAGHGRPCNSRDPECL